jgi:chromosomal replication initiator protein
MQTSVEGIWGKAQERLRTMLNTDLYNLWFAPLRAVNRLADVVTLEVANDFCEVWLKDNYLDLLQNVLSHESGQQIKVDFHIAATAPAAPLPAPEVQPKKAKSGGATLDYTSPADLGFNPKYTFDTFVVGSTNSFSHAAAMAVAQSPGKSYNPLFLYAGVGLGKTHLLHAIGQQLLSQKKGARVAYLSSEKFTNEYIDAIQNSQLVKFRKKYRQTDMLLIDDVQFLAGKERIQEEFFHTFNALHESHKQIVLTCDRPPAEMQNLEQRLMSRLEWGLVADLQPPDVETRVAILLKKEAMIGVHLPSEVIHFIADRIRTNIRRLEGALIRLTSYITLTNKKPTLELAEELLRELLHEEGRFTINITIIQKRVAEHFDIRMTDMVSKRRPENIAFPRQIAMFLSRQMTENSLSAIGEAFGGRDHGTVLHACRLVKDRMEVDESVRQAVNYLEKQLTR